MQLSAFFFLFVLFSSVLSESNQEFHICALEVLPNELAGAYLQYQFII